MKKLVLLFTLLTFSGVQFANAQVCVADPQYTIPGIYPDSATNLACAVVDSLYTEIITVVIPVDTVADIGTGPLDFWIDSIVLVSVSGLPNGIVLAGCSPASCGWLGGTTGCLAVIGTPTTTGLYPLEIITRSCVTAKISNLIKGCQDDTIDYYSINVVERLIVTATGTNPGGCTSNDGSVSLTVTGGSGAGTYEYLWSNAAATSSLSGLGGGTYSVTVTDSCFTRTASATITEPGNTVQAILTTATNITTNGGSDGAIDVSVTGGTGSYTYSWDTSPVNTNQNLSGLSAGTYVLTATDAGGCSSTLTVTLTEPVGIDEASVSGFSGVHNVPNPFTNQTEIQFAINGSGSVDFFVYNLLGKVVYTENLSTSNGLNKFQFSSDGIAPGIYIYSLKDKNATATGRMIISRK